MVNNGVNMTANDRVFGIAKERGWLRPLLLKLGVLAKGVCDLDRLPTVRRLVDIHRDRSTQYVAVISPYEHFRTVDVPRMHTIQRMVIPTGFIGIL